MVLIAECLEKKYVHEVVYEFCFKKLCSIGNLHTIAKKCNFEKITILTPFVTQSDISKIKKFFDSLHEIYPKTEVVFNDWGVFHLIKQNGYKFKTIAGRLINKQKKDPRIRFLLNKINFKMINYFRSTPSDNSYLLDFLVENKIYRIEMDNVIQGFNKIKKIKASIYYPKVLVTVSRMCMGSEYKYIFKETCSQECLKNLFVIKKYQLTRPIYIEGNHQYYLNYKIPKDLDKLNVDRIVYNGK